ncbi:DinB family protein [Paraflavitalea sp. CAU 1676]|uniref:DinB family protein n=1 Tax=Paraflavitalea sp. CAU 1676 TaxID=3032598 RepID=UPI0023DADEEA|nr:DinB family protein [Paraflavitalea sp. CAU 1676]MDF2193252.1 DinB family protein [Paraflavitalea sp. CAU 1676]
MPVKNYIDLPYPHLDKLLKELDDTGREWLQAIAAFSQQQINQIPFAGSWTGGQVAEHIYKSIQGIPHLMAGNTTATTHRKPDDYVKTIEDIFLDFDNKMKSPEFILPSDGPHDRNQLLQQLRGVFDDIAVSSRTLDMSFTCTDFEFPGVGHFTRWEWVSFAICHTRRHARQLQHILKHLATVPA